MLNKMYKWPKTFDEKDLENAITSLNIAKGSS